MNSRLPIGFNRLVPQGSRGNLGALLMGLTMGIVAAPCIGPFVIGLLVHVGNKGEPVYGFFMFFVLALGLGLPYLILGTFSSALKKLPRSGQWMVTVRRLFGLVLLAMALYFVNPLLGQYTAWALVAFLATSAAYLILVEARRASSRVFAGLLGCLGAGLGLAAVLLVPGEPKGRHSLGDLFGRGTGTGPPAREDRDDRRLCRLVPPLQGAGRIYLHRPRGAKRRRGTGQAQAGPDPD